MNRTSLSLLSSQTVRPDPTDSTTMNVMPQSPDCTRVEFEPELGLYVGEGVRGQTSISIGQHRSAVVSGNFVTGQQPARPCQQGPIEGPIHASGKKGAEQPNVRSIISASGTGQ